MHQLGNKTDREDTKNKIKEILMARRRFYEAGVTLLEYDNIFAGNVKRILENMTFVSKVVNIIGAGGYALPIDASMVRFYLEVDYRICVREENITVDLKNRLCSIKLDSKQTAYIPIVEKIGIKSLINKCTI